MQDGLTADTTHGSAIHVVQASGGAGGVVAYQGAEGGNGPGSALNREDCPDGNKRQGVQIPRIVDGQRWPSPRTAGMILRVSPEQVGWVPWPELGAVFREYQMRQAQTLSAVQRTVGRGGPIIGARRISIRLALRPGRIVQSPGSTPLSCHQHPAPVAVLVSTNPSTGPPRYWSEKDPQGWLLRDRRRQTQRHHAQTLLRNHPSPPHMAQGAQVPRPIRGGPEERWRAVPSSLPSPILPQQDRQAAMLSCRTYSRTPLAAQEGART
jgi:hypothetical protein